MIDAVAQGQAQIIAIPAVTHRGQAALECHLGVARTHEEGLAICRYL